MQRDYVQPSNTGTIIRTKASTRPTQHRPVPTHMCTFPSAAPLYKNSPKLDLCRQVMRESCAFHRALGVRLPGVATLLAPAQADAVRRDCRQTATMPAHRAGEADQHR